MILNHFTISTKKVALIIFGVLFFVSLAFNGWLVYQISLLARAYEVQQINTKTLNFTRMFVENVLMAKGEIDFETRLALEAAVRNLDDQQIFDQWQRFTKAVTKEEASNEVKILLDLLVKRISR